MMRALAAIVLTTALLACDDADRRRPVAYGITNVNEIPALEPGRPTNTTVYADYTEDEWSLYLGRTLYMQLNCVGCHANGGGGIGPALSDDEWIYGSEPIGIFATIMEGRPGGMPAFGGRITAGEAWNLVAYVRSLARLAPASVWSDYAAHMRGPETAHEPSSVQLPELDSARPHQRNQ